MKSIQLAPWQLTSLRAGRLRSLWVPLTFETDKCPAVVMTEDDGKSVMVKYTDASLSWYPLPYAAGDVLKLKQSPQFDEPCSKGGWSVSQARITDQPTVRLVNSITIPEIRAAGVEEHLSPNNFAEHWEHDHPNHPWESAWAIVLNVEVSK